MPTQRGFVKKYFSAEEKHHRCTTVEIISKCLNKKYISSWGTPQWERTLEKITESMRENPASAETCKHLFVLQHFDLSASEGPFFIIQPLVILCTCSRYFPSHWKKSLTTKILILELVAICISRNHYSTGICTCADSFLKVKSSGQCCFRMHTPLFMAVTLIAALGKPPSTQTTPE